MTDPPSPADLDILTRSYAPVLDRVRSVRIVAELCSPVACDPGRPLMIDGAIQHAIIEDATDCDPHDLFAGWRGPTPRIWTPVLEVEVNGLLVPSISQAFWLTDPYESMRTCRQTVDVEKLGLARVVTAFGRWKSHVIEKSVLVGAWVCWYARADVEGLRALLPRLATIGRSPNQGLGAVARWWLEETPEDWSLRCEGNPTRPIPDGCGPVVGYRAPYWHRENKARCQLPDPDLEMPPWTP